jgi:DNA-binding IscR family transcriptional regulator
MSLRVTLIGVFAFALWVGFTIYLWYEQDSRMSRFREAFRLVDALVGQEFDLKRQVLESVGFNSMSYDKLVEAELKMDALVEKLASSVEKELVFDAHLKSDMRVFLAQEKEQKHLIEAIKSKNAVLRNSLFYLVGRLDKSETVGSVKGRDETAKLIAKALAFHIRSDEVTRASLEKALSLSASQGRARKKAGDEIDHLRIVLTAKNDLNKAFSSLQGLSLMQELDDIKEDIGGIVAREAVAAGEWRIALLGVSGLLFALGLGSFIEAVRGRAHLSELNRTLQAQIDVEFDLRQIIDSLDRSAIVAFTDAKGKITLDCGRGTGHLRSEDKNRLIPIV